ncbi:MAG: hypothetical protein U1E29_07180 [Coriobacteriia bacterium]|nr:hypothetical protein [Coriobacteriia bacterium]
MRESDKELIDRAEVTRLYATLFGVRFGDRMFTHFSKALGLLPTEYQTLAGRDQKGRVGLYDPVLVHLLAGVNNRCKGRLESMSDELEPYRLLWDQLRGSLAAKEIPGFVDDREYGAWLLMLTSPDYGLAPAELYRRVRERPELLDCSRFGHAYLVNVFMAYKEAYIAALERMEFDKSPNDPDLDGQRMQWAQDWVTAAARYFEGDREGGCA